MTIAEAEQVLEVDIEIAVDNCERTFASFDDIDIDRQESLVEMAFVLGGGTLRKFKKMIAAVNGRDWELASAEAGLNSVGDGPSLWVRQIGHRAQEIVDSLRG